MRRVSQFLNQLPSGFYSRPMQLVIDLVLSSVAVFVAFHVRFENGLAPGFRFTMWAMIVLVPIVRWGSITALNGYEILWRYFSFRDVQLLAFACLPPTMLLLLIRATRPASFPISTGVVVIEYATFLFMAASARGMRRLVFELSRGDGSDRKRALVIGSDDTLAAALHDLQQNPNISILGLLAPEQRLHGKVICGVTVLGGPEQLATVLVQHSIALVLVADASMPCVGECVATAAECGTEVRLLPSANNVLRGDVKVHASPNPEVVLAKAAGKGEQRTEVIEAFRGRSVLITGAGGSIGSELCNQVSAFPVKRIILLDQDENSIFEIHAELRQRNTKAELVQVVGDIRNTSQMRRVFSTYSPDIVLHAAAYKHVPLMEVNRSQAVMNNVIGTREIADLAIELGVERFLMISTDKAVRPTSIMGATKRVAEILVHNRAVRPGCKTKFACVRFGNVLGSRGSVVPIFLRQIAEGRPVTITHELMTRYFMTIPEAVQLVLQAVTLALRGEVYMLDMGDPVEIMTLARKLIQAAGLRPGIDIPINITGIRPGEKLHEQLWSEGAHVTPTSFKRVFRVVSSAVPPKIDGELVALERLASAGAEGEILGVLKRLPIDFLQQHHTAVASARK
ncbi:MAG TPA: nucleoside-diphosphate sugar epimerase/dehydratase [Clostridia bacterium]|nr:nucleoside-diphosphate sugar epimerase/dehydratase [Clostridia bacterium]